MPHRTANRKTHTYPRTTTPSPLYTFLPNQITKMGYKFEWKLPDFCSRAIKVRSRRKRRRDDTKMNTISIALSTFVAPATTNNSPNNISNCRLSKMLPGFTPVFLSDIMQSFTSKAMITAIASSLLILSTCSLCAASPCDSHHWWDPVRDKCIPCTDCNHGMIPFRPCQLHRDTICRSISDLKIDWVVMAKTEPNWKERRKSENNEETLPLDWQTAALFMAVLACLLFFIVAACILIHHMRQWRRMERRLDQDVEELSTKLMAKLAEVQSLEGGTFFIGTADALRVPTTFQPQHVLLPDKSSKYHDRRIIKTLQPGNVYIEENGSKG